MTVGELIEVFGDNLKNIEVVIRENGDSKYIQGYRVGEHAEIYPYEKRVELIEAGIKDDYHKQVRLRHGAIKDVLQIGGLKMKVIAKKVKNAPEYIKELEICHAIPRRIYQLHGEQLINNTFDLEINCYPDGFEPKEEPRQKPKGEELQQLSIFEL